MTIELPWPPSINHYWRRVGARTLISRQGREYKSVIAAFCKIHRAERFGASRVRVEIVAFMPDRRRRDLDNLIKPLLDALTGAGLWEDDSQVDDLRICRGAIVPGGLVQVRIDSIVRE